jgi:hypothetical protein
MMPYPRRVGSSGFPYQPCEILFLFVDYMNWAFGMVMCLLAVPSNMSANHRLVGSCGV